MACVKERWMTPSTFQIKTSGINSSCNGSLYIYIEQTLQEPLQLWPRQGPCYTLQRLSIIWSHRQTNSQPECWSDLYLVVQWEPSAIAQ